MKHLVSGGWLVFAMVFGIPAAQAQLAPETPRMLPPDGPGGLGVHWLRGEVLPGDGDAVLVTWSPSFLPARLRLRGGGGAGVEGEAAGFGGFDVQAPLARGRRGQPLDLDWYSGLGVGVGQYALVTLPLGLSGGLQWSSGSVWLAPYVSAGVAADLRLGEYENAEEFEVHPAVDVGLDMALDPGRSVILRAATSLGDRQAIAVGLVVGGGRPTRP